MEVTFSKSGIIWCILMIIGCVMIGKGFTSQTQYYNSIKFEDLDSTDFEIGEYVSDNITSLVKIEARTNTYRAYSGDLGNYREYTVPAGNNKYVRLYIKDRKTKEQLDEAANKESFSIPFTGQITSSTYSVSYKFYEHAGGIEPEQIITEYVLIQSSAKKANLSLIYGFTILISCLVIRLFHVLPSIVTVDDIIVETPRQRLGAFSNCEVEIESQKLLISRLEAQMEKLYKGYCQCLILVPIGMAPIVILIIFLSLKTTNAPAAIVVTLIYYVASIVGIFILSIALTGICQYSIHMDNNLGIFLRSIKSITPIPKQIENCKENIKYLEEKLAYENSMTTIYSDKTFSELNPYLHKFDTPEEDSVPSDDGPVPSDENSIPSNEDEDSFILLPEEETDDINE